MALAESQLRAVTDDAPTQAGPGAIDRRVLLSALVVRDRPAALDAAELAGIVGQLQQGRRVADGWVVNPPAREALRAALLRATVDPTRASLLTWSAERVPEVVRGGLTVTELFRLGGAGNLPRVWGVLSIPFDGCVCLTATSRGVAAEYVEYWQIGLSSASNTDLPLRVAEELAALKLPLSLVPDVLPAATLDWINHLHPYSQDDWQAFVVWPRQLTQARVEEYLLGLVKQGILVAPREQLATDNFELNSFELNSFELTTSKLPVASCQLKVAEGNRP